MEFSEAALISRILRHKETQVGMDIGANKGDFTILLMQNCRIVHAFEPAPGVFNMLRANVDCKSLELRKSGHEVRVHLNKIAVSELSGGNSRVMPYNAWTLLTEQEIKSTRVKIAGGAPLVSPGALDQMVQGGAERDAFAINFTSIDDYQCLMNIDRLDFIKIDTDGFEVQVLKGAADTLERFRPAMMIELSDVLLRLKGYDARDLARELSKLGYRMYDLVSARLIGDDIRLMRSAVPSDTSIDVICLHKSSKVDL